METPRALKKRKSAELDTYMLWQDLVNLGPKDLKILIDSRYASPPKKYPAPKCTKLQSLRQTLRLVELPFYQWTAPDHQFAKKQVCVIKRTLAAPGLLYVHGKRLPKPTRRLIALLRWGHDPDKFAKGKPTRVMIRLRNQAKHDRKGVVRKK